MLHARQGRGGGEKRLAALKASEHSERDSDHRVLNGEQRMLGGDGQRVTGDRDGDGNHVHACTQTANARSPAE